MDVSIIVVNWNSRGDATLQFEQVPSFYVRGTVKMYRHACWDVIGGLLTSPGWDTVDE